MKNYEYYQRISECNIEKGRYILIAYRKELYKIRHCQTCKKPFNNKAHKRTIDHKIPLWNGGTNERKNLQAICLFCHTIKNMEEEKLKKELQKMSQNKHYATS